MMWWMIYSAVGWAFLALILWVGFFDIQKRNWSLASVCGVLASFATGSTLALVVHALAPFR